MSTTSTASSGSTTSGSRIITTTFSTASATWTAVIDLDHSTTIALLQDGTSITQSTSPLPSNTRPNWPRPTSTSTQRPPGQAPSSLYLLTFAITLSLLLSISLAILLRNLVQRGRERRIREAVAAGLIPPDSLTWIWRAQLGLSGLGRWGNGGGSATSVPRRVGPQPVLWDSWLAADGAEKGNAVPQEKDPAVWAAITPLSIAPLTIAPPSPTTTTDAASAPPPLRRRTFVEYIFHLPPMPHIPSSPPSPVPGTGSRALATEDDVAAEQERMIAELFREPSSTPTTAAGPPPGVRVALYIAMPRDSRRAQTRGVEEGGLTDVDAVLGTSDVRWDASRPPLSATLGPASGSGSNVR